MGFRDSGAIILLNRQPNPAAPPPFTYTYTNFQGCHVRAAKTATAVGIQNWEVFHMETQAPNGPF